jgi:hypothetical protein
MVRVCAYDSGARGDVAVQGVAESVVLHSHLVALLHHLVEVDVDRREPARLQAGNGPKLDHQPTLQATRQAA